MRMRHVEDPIECYVRGGDSAVCDWFYVIKMGARVYVKAYSLVTFLSN